MRAALHQFLRFSAVGTIGFIIDAGFLQLLVSLAGLDPYISRLFSYLIAATLTWQLNRHFTFPKHTGVKPHHQWFYYLGANGVGGLLNYAVYALLIFKVPFFHAHLYLGVAAGAIIGLSCNFALSKHWVFKPPSVSGI